MEVVKRDFFMKDCIATLASKHHMKYFLTLSTQKIESKNVLYGIKCNKFCKDLETMPLEERMYPEVAVLLLVCMDLYFT